jgi:hypothetical protein
MSQMNEQVLNKAFPLNFPYSWFGDDRAVTVAVVDRRGRHIIYSPRTRAYPGPQLLLTSNILTSHRS